MKMRQICEHLGITGLDKKLLINHNGEDEANTFCVETPFSQIEKVFDIFDVNREKSEKEYENKVVGINEDTGMDTIVVIEQEDDLNVFTFYGCEAVRLGRLFKIHVEKQ
jgi:hypothetical protein